MMLQNGSEDEWTKYPSIKRLPKNEIINVNLPEIEMIQYTGPSNPEMPREETPCTMTDSLIDQSNDSARINSEFDFLYLKCQAEFEGTPSYSGYCTRQARESGRSLQQSTSSMYLPLIDAKPADKSTILTAKIKATELTKTTGQSFTVFTCDQQLYKLLVQIKWAHLEKFTNFIPRLGGMHFLMAFISSIGTLMVNTGLDDLLKAAFGGVEKCFQGRTFLKISVH